MHGWMNGMLERFIKDKFGCDFLEDVVQILRTDKMYPDENKWVVFQEYPDAATLLMVQTVCERKDMGASDVLEEFGRYFLQKIRSDDYFGYAQLLRCQGNSLRSWLSNVNDLHSHLQSAVCATFSFPELWCTDNPGAAKGSESTFLLNYRSPRGGGPLRFLLMGITKDAAESYFDLTINMQLLVTQGENNAAETVWCIRCDPSDEKTISAGQSASAEKKGRHTPARNARSAWGGGGACGTDDAQMSPSLTSGATIRCPFSQMHVNMPTVSLSCNSSLTSESSEENGSDGEFEGDKSSPKSCPKVEEGLTKEEMSRMFPFHFKVNQALVVTSAGCQLKRRVKKIVGAHVDSFCSVVKPPHGKWNWPDLQRCERSTFELLLTSCHGLKLTGGLYISRCPTTSVLTGTFMVSPSVTSLDEMYQHGLSMDLDIPRHTSQRRLIMMNEHLKSETYLNSRIQNESDRRKRSLDLKRLFVRYVSHEVRTPLNTISIGLDLVHAMRTKLLPALSGQLLSDAEELFAIVDEAKDSAHVAVETLNEMLLYEKIDGGLLALELAPQPVVHTILKMVEQQSVPCRAKSINLRFTFDEESFGENELESPTVFVLIDRHKVSELAHACSAFSVHCKRARSSEVHLHLSRSIAMRNLQISQVIRNVLSNAIKFSPENSTVHVHLSVVTKACALAVPIEAVDNDASLTALASRKFVLLEARDSGAGISPDNLAKLFHSIVQFNAGALQAGGGSGIGLYVSKGIMDLHGGALC